MALRQDVTTSRWNLQSHPLREQIKLLLIAAMCVFAVTILIGLINGQRMVFGITLSNDVILTHVHAGTLGWITLSVFATGLWLFGENLPSGTKSVYLRWLSIIAVAAVPLYVLAFLSGNYIARATFGVPVLLVIVGFFGWIAGQIGRVKLAIPQLAVLFALFVLIIGAILGVLLQIQFVLIQTTHKGFLPDGAFAAHPASLVGGYLVLIGMALAERTFVPAGERLPRWGLVQIIGLFISGLALAVGLLLQAPPFLGLSLLLYVLSGIVFLFRMIRRIVAAAWLERVGNRLFAASSLFILFEIALGTVVILLEITLNGNVPDNLIIALDHTTFVGLMTNALFGLILAATTERSRFWPWADHVLFWGLNIGVLGFVISLIVNARFLEPLFTPILGLSILLGLLTYVIRLLQTPTVTEATLASAETAD